MPDRRGKIFHLSYPAPLNGSTAGQCHLHPGDLQRPKLNIYYFVLFCFVCYYYFYVYVCIFISIIILLFYLVCCCCIVLYLFYCI